MALKFILYHYCEVCDSI